MTDDEENLNEDSSEKLVLPFEEPFLPLLPLDHQTLSSSDHHLVSCVCSSSRCALPVLLNPPLLLPLPLPFDLEILKLSGLPSVFCSLSSHVQKHDLSSSKWPCSPVTSSVAHSPNSSSAQFSTMEVLFVLPPCPLTERRILH